MDPTGRRRREAIGAIQSGSPDREIYAFMEIPPNIMDEEAEAQINVYSEDTGLSSFVGWVRRTINERAKAIRFLEIGLNPDDVRSARPLR